MGKLSLREVKWHGQSHTDYERQGFQPSLHKASCAVLSCSSIAYLCNPRDCSPPGFSVHGILQVRILEWVAMLSSRGTSQPRAKPWPNWIPVSSTILLRLSSSAIQKVALWYHCLLHIFPKATSSSGCLNPAKSQLPCPTECGPEGGVPSGRGSQLSSRPRF